MEKKHKILIVEDEAFLSEMYQMKLELAGYEVDLAHDGEEALKKIETSLPEIVLLDIYMPKIDGFEVLKRIKSDKRTKSIKVCIFSNLGQQSEIEKGIQGGAERYLIKANLTPNQLVKNVREMIG